jgi:hypothetical protein
MVNSAPPVLHQGLGQVRHADEEVDRDVHGLPEALARAVDDAAVQVVAGGEGDRVEEEVEPAPPGLDLLEQGLELALGHDVQGLEDRGLELLRQGLDMRPRPCRCSSSGPTRRRGSGRPGAAIGDRLLVGDADDEAFLPLSVKASAGNRGAAVTAVSPAGGGTRSFGSAA